jgi:hypothetical protein
MCTFSLKPRIPCTFVADALITLHDIRFLTLTNVAALEDRDSPAPWHLISLLSGALGPCLTQAARHAEVSSLQTAAQLIRVNNAAFGAGDSALADRVKPFAASLDMPNSLLASGNSPEELKEDFQDRVQYNASDHGRKTVEAERFQLLRSAYAHPSTTHTHSPSKSPKARSSNPLSKWRRWIWWKHIGRPQGDGLESEQPARRPTSYLQT